METKIILLTAVVFAAAYFLHSGALDLGKIVSADDPDGTTDEASDVGSDQWRESIETESTESATFAGGCFWCIEGAFENVEGVKAAISGYAGGKESTATYGQVTTGRTDHREAVRIEYHPSNISYSELLDLYWKSIDPTDAGGQFTDRGPHYTTAIYPHDEEQYRLAKQSKRNLSGSGKFEEPIVTKIQNFTTFFRAEDKHQNYSRENSVRYESYERLSGRKGFVEKVWDNSPLSK